MKWSESDKQRAFAMRANKMKLREIAAHFPGRNEQQIRGMLTRDEVGYKSLDNASVAILGTLGDGAPPPLYLIKEAVLRAAYPRTPTMFFCGDPVLNQCALFRKENGDRL